jgi:hypothetical protein
MNKRQLLILPLTVLVLLVTCNALAYAQATRTWVSILGADTNLCSHAAPCRTFSGAISKTASGGEIKVVDTDAFGAVVITKSITISTEGVKARIEAAGTNGIVINALANDLVVLRGLDIDGMGTGLSGIKLIGAGALHIENLHDPGFSERFGAGYRHRAFDPRNQPSLYQGHDRSRQRHGKHGRRHSHCACGGCYRQGFPGQRPGGGQCLWA